MNSVLYLRRNKQKRKRGKVATQEIADLLSGTMEMVDKLGPSVDQVHFKKIEPRVQA